MVIVDTSVLIAFLRGERTKGALFLRSLENQNVPYAIPAVCAQEVMQGAKDKNEFSVLREYLSVQELIGPTDLVRHYCAAAEIFFDCRGAGFTIRSSVDCSIAQLALERNGVLLHNDRDFAAIGKVRKLKFAI